MAKCKLNEIWLQRSIPDMIVVRGKNGLISTININN